MLSKKEEFESDWKTVLNEYNMTTLEIYIKLVLCLSTLTTSLLDKHAFDGLRTTWLGERTTRSSHKPHFIQQIAIIEQDVGALPVLK